MKQVFTRIFLSVFIFGLFFGNIFYQNTSYVFAEEEIEQEENLEEFTEEEWENQEEEVDQEIDENSEANFDEDDSEEVDQEKDIEVDIDEEWENKKGYIEEEFEQEIEDHNENNEETYFDENESEDSEEVDMNDEDIQEVFADELEEKEIEIEELKEEIHELENNELENEEIFEELGEENNQLEENLEYVENELEEEINEKEELENQVEELETIIDEQDEELDEVVDENIEIIKELEQTEKEIEELEWDLQNIEKELIKSEEIINKLQDKYSQEVWIINPSTDTIEEISFQKLEAILPENEYFIELWERVFFDSYDSELFKNTQIYWNFWDGKFSKNRQSVSHLYKEPWEYNIILKLVDGENVSQTNAKVYVSDKTFVLLTDSKVSSEEIDKLKNEAKIQNATLKIISTDYSGNNFELEEKMTKALLAEKNILSKADGFISLSNSSLAINAYNRALKAENISTDKKQFIVLNDNKSEAKLIAKTHDGTFWNYQNVIVTWLEATPAIFAAQPENISKNLESKNIDFSQSVLKDTDFIHPGNFLSKIVDLLIEKNVAPNVVMLILMLPIAATVVVFFRQIIGLTSFGIFTPALIAVTFLATWLSYGLIMFFIILIAWVGLRGMIQNVKLLSVPRISLVMIFVSFIMILLLWIWAYLDHAFVYSIWAFPMLILAFVIEKFVTTQHEKWFKDAVILLLSTLFIAIVSYFVMNWQYLQTLLMAYAEIIFLLVVINIVLGKYTGMRVLEYIRFKVLINKVK